MKERIAAILDREEIEYTFTKRTQPYEHEVVLIHKDPYGEFNIPLDQFRGMSDDEIWESITRVFQKALEATGKEKYISSALESFDNIKNKIYIRLCGYKRMDNQYVKPFVPGLYISLYIDASGFNVGVTEEMVNHYGISDDELINRAIQNTARDYPPVITPLSGFVQQLTGSDVPDVGLYIMTNQQLYFGASTLAYPGFTETLPDCIVIPSSVHEVLLMSTNYLSDGRTPESLIEIVKEVNQMIMVNEVLSENMYMIKGGKLIAYEAEKVA